MNLVGFFKMSQFQEDMIFKNVGEEDARILLDILGKNLKK